MVRRTGRLLVGILAALLLFFLLGEVLARSMNLVDRLNGFPRQLYRATDDDELPYVLRPSLDTVARGERVILDEHGTRISSEAAPAPAGARRILLLGDSVVFGYRMPFDETLGARLEEKLEHRTGSPHQVVNAGVEGYNTQNQLAWLQRFGLALDPDMIVVVFNLNDYDYGPVMGPNGVLTTDRTKRVSTWSLANLSDFYVLLRWLYKIGTHMPAGDAPAAGSAAPGPTPAFLDFDVFVSKLRKNYYRKPTDERWPQLLASLEGLQAESERAGVPLLIAILPDGDQIGVAEPDLIPQERLQRICADLRLDCLDLYAAFEAHSDEGRLFMDIMHPNARGHEIVAGALAGRLAGPPP